MSAFTRGIELVGKVKSPDGKIQTKELLDVCREVVLIVGEALLGALAAYLPLTRPFLSSPPAAAPQRSWARALPSSSPMWEATLTG